MNASTTSNTCGDLGRYVEGRERVLGALRLPRDPEVAFDALCEQLGGRWLAIGYLHAALDAANGPGYWIDHFGNKVRW